MSAQTTKVGARSMAALAALAAVVAGCAQSGGEAVSAANLQKDVAERLTKAGQKPQSVTCQGGLSQEAGSTTRCDVVLSDTNAIQPVITLTTADPLNYAVTPAVSRDQLSTAVSALLGNPQIACRSGLDGKIGAQAQCEETRDGAVRLRVVEVTNVEGLLMSYAVLPVLDRRQVQDLLVERITVEKGERPQRAECAGDLQGEVGATLDCMVTTGGDARAVVLTVTTVKGDVIDFTVADAG